MRLLFFVGIVWTSIAYAQNPYTPEFSDPINESWRIKPVDELKHIGVTCINAAKDGSMWLGHESGIIQYDGYYWNSISYDSVALQGIFTRKIIALDSIIYVMQHYGIFTYSNQIWSKVFSVSDSLYFRPECMVLSTDSVLLVGTKVGLVIVKDGWRWIYASSKLKELFAKYYPDFIFVATDNPATDAYFQVHAIVEESAGRFKFYDKDNGVINAWLTPDMENPLSLQFTGEEVVATGFSYANRDSKENIWISCEWNVDESVLYCFTPKGKLTYNPKALFGVSKKLQILSNVWTEPF